MVRLLIALISIAIIGLSSASLTFAQVDAGVCRSAGETALSNASLACQNAAPGQICYGHGALEASLFNASEIALNQPGDLVDAALMQNLSLGPPDFDNNLWGLSTLLLQIPGAEAQPNMNVRLLFFGDVEVENAVEPPTILEGVATAGLNVRALPSTDTAIVSSLRPNQVVMADGRLADSSWFRIIIPPEQVGWVVSDYLSFPDDSNRLPVVDFATNNSTRFAPMQAFNFANGNGAALCPAAPQSGVLAQIINGQGHATLLVNDTLISFDATIFMQAQADSHLTINTLDGVANMSAFETLQVVPAGARASIPLDGQLRAVASPNAPEPYATADLQSLPLNSLDRSVAVRPPIEVGELNALLGIPDSGTWQVTFEPGILTCPDGLNSTVDSSENNGARQLSVLPGGGAVTFTFHDSIEMALPRTAIGIYSATTNRIVAGADVPHDITLRVASQERILGEEILRLDDGCTITLAFEMALISPT